jgi:hypothetical protein
MFFPTKLDTLIKKKRVATRSCKKSDLWSLAL